MTGEFTIAQLAKAVAGEVKGDDQKRIRGAAPFDYARSDEVTFAVHPKFLKKLDQSAAGAVLVPLGTKAQAATDLICVRNPQAAFATVMGLFHPPKKGVPGIHPAAHIGENFVHGEALSIAPMVVLGEGVTVGDRVTLRAGAVVGDGVVMGDDVDIHPNVTIEDGCRIGSRVIIHAGTVVGSDGFGFAPDEGVYVKIPHAGIVRIDDDVEIGANNSIDRGTLGETWIQRGVKTDNLVHVAHNVTVGANTVLVAQVGIAGSTSIGCNAVLAGQVGVSGHLKIGDRVTIGPQAGVARSIPEGETVSGTPTMPHRIWLRVQRLLPELPELKKRITDLEKKLSQRQERSE